MALTLKEEFVYDLDEIMRGYSSVTAIEEKENNIFHVTLANKKDLGTIVMDIGLQLKSLQKYKEEIGGFLK